MRKLTSALIAFTFFISFSATSKAQTTLAAGDIAFTGYISAAATTDEFSFVLLAPITNGTVINFTDNGWLNTNVFRAGEQTVTWTCAGALPAGTEIKISGPGAGAATATLVGGGTNGTCTGTMPSLSTSGDQVLAYQGTVATPTFISAIHMNVYSLANFDPVNTDAATWDNTNSNTTSGSALPPGLTTGTTAIWVGVLNTPASEFDNAIFNCASGAIGTIAQIKALIYDQNNWTKSNAAPVPPMATPTGCNFLGALAAPGFTTHPSASTICAGANTSFTVVATNATSYQWQVDNGGGFTNITDNATYSGATTTTLNITAAPAGFNGNQYRCVATNGVGSTNSNNALLTVNPLPVNPTLLAKTPATTTVADGTPVSATFNAGSGGTGCSDDYRYTTNGGATYLPYTPGSNISTTGLAAGTGMVFIEGRRNNCSSGCTNSYVVLASWVVTPLPAGATTLNAGDIAFTGYTSTTAGDDFSFVLLRNIGPGTVINFTDNGWLSTNALQSAEQTITWTSNAAYSAGTEIKISGLTATLAAGGSAGTVTGVALSLSTSGDQILAYRGTAASPTFISAIHMNVYSTAFGDPVTTTAAAWDGTANTTSSSALPTGLTTGVNCIWIGTQGVPASEFANSHYGSCSGPGTLGPISTLRATLNNQANWISDNGTPPAFTLPTGCPYLGVGSIPNITGQPTSASVCENAIATFTVTAGGATSYQWQVNTGSGFNNVPAGAPYTGENTATLTITNTPLAFNTYQYQCILSNGSGSVTSNAATLTVTALPVSPTLLAKTPATATVADGTPVSATFNAGSGGTGCADDFRYTTDNGSTYLPYTPGSNISTTGLAATSGHVFIEGRRANCSAGCQGNYVVLAQWVVTPIPVAATTLNAGDIAFSAYASTATPDVFSFVLLRNIGPGTTLNFTDNGWLSTNVLQSAEQTITWTAPAGGLIAGTEITISGLTASKPGGGAAGTVTGTALSLSSSGDQILAYRGTAASPTFISAIHMNVYDVANGDPNTTTAAAWDGSANTQSSSALPTGLTTGVNCIWIGTQAVPSSEHNNAKYGLCNLPAVSGPIAALRAALNNQANWTVDDNTPPGFTQPTGCNYLSALCPTITVTNPGVTTGTAGTAFSQTFTATGGTAPHTFTTASALPTGLTLSSAGVLSGTPTQSGTFPIVVTATESGGCSGNGATYTLVIGCPPNSATATPSSQTICSGSAITTIVLSGGLPTSTYNWTRDNTGSVTGIAASGSGDISGSLTNTTSAPVTVTFTITPVIFGCNGTTTTATVIVNPTPDATATPASQSICTGSAITTIAITGSVTGTQYDWTRDNTGTVTGIAASGSGDISGSLTNTTNAPITVTFTITPTANGCPGTPITATVVVNPIPDATATPSSQSRCSGQNISTIVMGGAVGGTSFDWVRDNVGTVGGNIPANGSGNISGFFTNNTASPITVTFTITPTANGCPGTPITATVTVNPLPLAVITNGGQVLCKSDFVLNAATDPNYTYQWGRSLFSNPFTNMGTASAQTITASGEYLLTVTNQYGCQDTAMTMMSLADYVFNGSLATGDAVQTGRLNRFAVVSTCAAPKACPGTFTTTGSRLYDSYTITNNRNVPVCATIGHISRCGTNAFCVAYTGSYNPTSLCTNYLADPGSSPLASIFYEATIPANGTIVVVVHEVNTSTGCASYTLTVDVPRDPGSITVTPGNPSCSGGPVTLTAPVANGYSWTPGGATTQAINVTPPTGTTPYSVHLTYGNNGCAADSTVNVVVASTPDVAAVSNQYFCTGSPAAISFTSTVPGTTFNWTNTNTAIGLGASGSGNLNFTATNATAAPISGTITVTPVNGACTGTPITFTIGVSPLATITGVTEDSVCSPGGVVNLAAAGSGNINWYNALTGGIVVNSGNTYTPNISATTTYYVEALAPPAAGTTTLTMPAQSNTFPGNVRGYWFTAPTDFVITSLSVPTTASSAGQSIAVLKFNGNVPPPVFSATTNAFTTLFFTRNNTGSASIPCNIPVAAGEVIGLLGYRGTINSYAPGDYNTTIAGFPVQLQRMGMQFPLTTTDPRDIWREFGATTSISRIEFEYSASQSCTSTPRVPVTGTVIPTPVATATPASQTVCSGPITTIVLSSTVPGTTFAWTRDNTVNVTGIPANGTGDISGTLTNNTFVPQTVTFTITPTSPDGCVGASITATVTVNAVPTIVCPANITLSNALNQCGNTATYTPTVTGIPVPTLTYTFTGATTGSGSGDGSGSFFNVGTTTVSITATNSCGTANCSFTVTVNDTQPPTVTVGTIGSCYPTVAAAEAAALAATSATDNCPGALTETASTVGTCSAVVTVRTTDGAGNFTDVTYNTRIDNTPPVVTCPLSIVVCGPAAVPAPNTASVTATDNCPGAITITHQGDVATPTPFAPYDIIRTYRATDGCGNFTECTQTITVNPIPNAVATPASQTVCSGFSLSPVILSGNVANTVFSWTRDNNATVTGLAASGTGDIHGALTNTTNAPVTVTFTITPSYTNAGTTCTGTPITATVIVNPTPNAVATPAAQTICSGSAITTIVNSGNVTNTVFNWTRDNTATVTGIAGSGAGDISGTLTNTTTSPVTVTFTIIPSYTNAGATCTGTPITATVVVNPVPNAVAAPAAQTICSGSAISSIAISGNVIGTVFNWTRNNTGTVTGIAGSGTGDISGTLTNTTNAPVTVTFTITPSYTNAGTTCTGAPITATVVVNPIPNAVATPASQTVCSANPITTIVLSGNVAGTVYSWTRDNTAAVTGIAGSGTGNISGTLTNTTNNQLFVTFTIIPSYNNAGVTCTGAPITATVLVNPTPNAVANPASQTICSANPIASIILSGNVANTVFNWTRNNTATVTGIAASGSGSNISGTLTNTTNAPVTVTFTITPVANGCTGAPITATVVVNPTPNVVAAPTTQTICSGTAMTPITFTGNVAGTSFNWTRDNTTTVAGLPGSGSGTISGTLTNVTTAPVTITFTITPVANGCPGTPVTATVVVNPTPTIVCPANIVVNAAPGTCGIDVLYPPVTVTGVPTPTVTYSIPSGSNFPVGVTTVTVTATNICGTATCTFTVTVNDVRVPVITTQPVNRAVCVGNSASFSVVATNAASYQWQTGSGNLWGNIAGATSATYTINSTVLTMNNSNYRVLVTGPCGTVVISNVVNLVVNPLPLVTLTSVNTPVLLPTTNTTIVASATPTGGSYAWLFNGNPITGATGPTLGPLRIDDLGVYRVIYTDLNGCVSTSNNMVISAQESDNLYVYPNPNDGHFTVRVYNTQNEDLKLNIFNHMGQKVFTKEIPRSQAYAQIDVDISRMANGVYTVELINSQNMKLSSKSVVVAR